MTAIGTSTILLQNICVHTHQLLVGAQKIRVQPHLCIVAKVKISHLVKCKCLRIWIHTNLHSNMKNGVFPLGNQFFCHAHLQLIRISCTGAKLKLLQRRISAALGGRCFPTASGWETRRNSLPLSCDFPVANRFSRQWQTTRSDSTATRRTGALEASTLLIVRFSLCYLVLPFRALTTARNYRHSVWTAKVSHSYLNAWQIPSAWELEFVMPIYLQKKICNATLAIRVRYFCTGYSVRRRNSSKAAGKSRNYSWFRRKESAMHCKSIALVILLSTLVRFAWQLSWAFTLGRSAMHHDCKNFQYVYECDPFAMHTCRSCICSRMKAHSRNRLRFRQTQRCLWHRLRFYALRNK